MAAATTQNNPIDDLTYDWLTVLQVQLPRGSMPMRSTSRTRRSTMPLNAWRCSGSFTQAARMVQEIKNHVTMMLTKRQAQAS